MSKYGTRTFLNDQTDKHLGQRDNLQHKKNTYCRLLCFMLFYVYVKPAIKTSERLQVDPFKMWC